MSERQPPRPEPAPKSNSLHPQPETAANLPLAKSPTEPRIFSAGTPSEQPPDNPLPADFDPVLEPPQLPELEQSGVLFEPGSGIRKPDFDRWPEIGYPRIGGGQESPKDHDENPKQEPREQRTPDTSSPPDSKDPDLSDQPESITEKQQDDSAKISKPGLGWYGVYGPTLLPKRRVKKHR